jgi:hypothetical protein
MDLKDAVLSTLAEIEEFEDEYKTQSAPQKPQQTQHYTPPPQPASFSSDIIFESSAPKPAEFNTQKFLVTLRERILVLFEGLQSINNSANSETLNVEKKLDLTINFLEFLLASIEEKLEVNSD